MPQQVRIAEALTVLPFIFPVTIPGLFIGCLISNILSPYGPIDMVFGSLATLIAAYLTSKMPNRYLAGLPPVIVNAVIVGGLITYSIAQEGAATVSTFFVTAGQIGFGQIIACYVIGLPLLVVMEKYIKPRFFNNTSTAGNSK